MTDPLKELGLNKKETIIYFSLYKLGPASIRQIAAKAKINRGTTYEVLKNLVKKGLATYFPKGKRRYFTAQSPETLLRLAEEKKERINQAVNQLRTQILPELTAIKPQGDVPQVHYYEGDEGIEKILQDVLRTVEKTPAKEYFVYSSKPVRKYIYRFFPNFTKQRIKRGIKVKVIAIGKGGEETKLSQRKWLNSKDGFSSLSYIIIYPPKFSLISIAQEEMPYGVVINESAVAQTQKLIFQSLWQTL